MVEFKMSEDESYFFVKFPDEFPLLIGHTIDILRHLSFVHRLWKQKVSYETIIQLETEYSKALGEEFLPRIQNTLRIVSYPCYIQFCTRYVLDI